MKNRNPSRVEIVKQFVSRLNDRFLRDDVPHYNVDTRTYSVGTFYLYETMGKEGYEYDVREVLDEKGNFKSLTPNGHNIDSIMYYLDGYLSGHFDTCDMLGYTLETVEDGEDDGEVNPEDNIFMTPKDQVAAADEMDEKRVASAQVLGTYQFDEEEEGEDSEESSPEKDEKK